MYRLIYKMDKESTQSRLNVGTDEIIPTREELNEAFSETISEQIYNDYYSHIFGYLESLSEQDSVTERDVFDNIPKNVNDKTKRDHLKNVFEYNPSYTEYVVDLNPPASAFVDRALQRENLEITPEYINVVKEACEDLADEFKDTYIEFHIERLKNKVKNEIGETLPSDTIDTELHNKYVNRFGELVATELPDELVSFDQSITKIAGDSNEVIAIRSLKFHDLEDEKHFIDITTEDGSDDNPGDLRVFTSVRDADPLNIEIKSTVIRERGGAGLARLNDPSILFGYFDDQSELAGNLDELSDESIAVYAQPETLAEMAIENREAYEKTRPTGQHTEVSDPLFFRANVIFAEDMAHYYRKAELPPRELGHEEEYT